MNEALSSLYSLQSELCWSLFSSSTGSAQYCAEPHRWKECHKPFLAHTGQSLSLIPDSAVCPSANSCTLPWYKYSNKNCNLNSKWTSSLTSSRYLFARWTLPSTAYRKQLLKCGHNTVKLGEVDRHILHLSDLARANGIQLQPSLNQQLKGVLFYCITTLWVCLMRKATISHEVTTLKFPHHDCSSCWIKSGHCKRIIIYFLVCTSFSNGGAIPTLMCQEVFLLMKQLALGYAGLLPPSHLVVQWGFLAQTSDVQIIAPVLMIFFFRA